MSLQGGPELRRRLKALHLAFKPIGKEWGLDVVRLAQPKLPVRTGKLRASIRVRNATQRKTVVAANFTAYFVDAGPKAHSIMPKNAGTLVFQASGRTIFARKANHPGYRGRPFRVWAAHQALRENPPAQEIIKLWNTAA